MPRRNTFSAPGRGASAPRSGRSVKVSTMASEPCRSRELLEDHAFERVVVLGQDEVAEPLAHLGHDRRELRADVVLVGAAHGQLGLDLRVMGAEAELGAAVRHQILDPAAARRHATRRARRNGSASDGSRSACRSCARRRGMTCSSSMRRNSRGTPGVKKKRALPMSIAKPHAVPIGLSRISAVEGSIACFLLFGGMHAAAAVEEVLHRRRATPRSATSSTPAACAAISCDRSSTVGPSPPLTMTASARSPACWKASSRLSRSSPTVVSQRTDSPTSSSFWRCS